MKYSPSQPISFFSRCRDGHSCWLHFLIFFATTSFVYSADAPDPNQILLKDFRPKSLYRTADTEVERARYPIFDLHTHPYAKTDADVARWVNVMDQVGVERSMILTYAVGEHFDELAQKFGQFPKRFSLWCGFDYSGYDQPGFGPAAVKELERCHAHGAIGVGELGDKGKGLFYGDTKAWGMHLDDPRMDSLLEKCADLKMPVSIHVADPIWMYEPMDSHNDGLMNAYKWRLDNQTNIVGHAGMIAILERAVRRHPRTTFIACHLANCSYDLSILGKLFDQYPNLYADIGARFAELAPIPRHAKQFLEKYQDRIVYGTDMTFNPSMYRMTFKILETGDEHFYALDQFGYHWALNGLDLDDAALKKIYRANALKILGLVRQ